MPRIPPSALRATPPNLARLLPAVRDLASARNELRWLREHVVAAPHEPVGRSSARRLAGLCRRRGRGVPLQYILGTQPFGDLEIRCGREVLIPRVETEAYTVHLAELLKAGRLVDRGLGALRIVDFCTGTGCIPLLLASLLSRSFPALHVHGVDISPRALSLSHQNLRSALSQSQIPPSSATQSVTFHHGDLLSPSWINGDLRSIIPKCDVLVSNPPYVSPKTWRLGRSELSYSTRKFEPKLALVPRQVDQPCGCRQEDVFYAALLNAASVLEPSVALFEFGGVAQGRRVLEYAVRHPFCRDAEFELWRDYPDMEGPKDSLDTQMTEYVKDRAGLERAVPIRGCGNVRSILIRKPTTRTL